MRKHIVDRTRTSALAVALIAAGCQNAPPGAGFTNGAPPSVESEKPAVRTDLPVAPAQGVGERAAEALGQGDVGPAVTKSLDRREQGLAGSDIGGTGSEAGIGGRNAGRGGTDPADPTGADRARTEPSATPPTVEYPNGGPPGGTKPGGNIQTGTPRGPQG